MARWDSEAGRGPVMTYVAGRVGLVALVVVVVAAMVWIRGGFSRPGKKKGGGPAKPVFMGKVGRSDLPSTPEAVRSFCKQWRVSLAVSARPKKWGLVLYGLPGAFPPSNQLSPDDARTGALRRQLEAPGLRRRKRGELLWRLGKVYAMRARYFRRLAPRLPARRRALRHLRRGRRGRRRARPARAAPAPARSLNPSAAGGAPAGGAAAGGAAAGGVAAGARPPGGGLPGTGPRPGAGSGGQGGTEGVAPGGGRIKPRTRGEAERLKQRSLKVAHHYYHDFVTRRLRVPEQDQLLYQYASVLIMMKRYKQALGEVEQLVQNFPFSAYTMMARVYAAGRHFVRRDCEGIKEAAEGLKTDEMGSMGALAAFYLGVCAQTKGDFARARLLLTKVFGLARGRSNRPPLNRGLSRRFSRRVLKAASRRLAQAYQKTGNPEDAVSFFKSVGSPYVSQMIAVAVNGYLKDGLAQAGAMVCQKAGEASGRRH